MPSSKADSVEPLPDDIKLSKNAGLEPAETDYGMGVVTSDEETQMKALKQIEFYFADSNLPYDRFMWTLHTANADHWVPISTVASFKRMRRFQANGIPWVAEALRKSESLLEVDETGTKVRRREEVKEPKGQFERSVYAKGFGDETPNLQDELELFFAKFGKVNAVRMRRIEETKKFKGSVFCEFADFDDAVKFLSADPKPQWNGNDLLTMSKDAYCEMKIKEKGLTGKAANLRKSGGLPGKKGFNAFSPKAKEKEKGKTKKVEAQERLEIYLEFMGKRLKVNEEDGGSVVESEIPFTKGATLKFNGCGGDVKFADVKIPLKDRFERPPFIKYQRGEDSGLVGFDKELTDEDISFVREKLSIINGNEVTWDFPDEATEKKFQIERAQSAAQRIVSSSAANMSGSTSRGGRGGRGVRGGRGRGRGRGGRGGRGGSDGRGHVGEGTDKANEMMEEVGGDKEGTSGESKTRIKRKQAVEPDGGPDTKGQSVPIVHISKKPRLEKEQET